MESPNERSLQNCYRKYKEKKKRKDKRQRDLKATLKPLEVGGRVLLRNLIGRGILVKFAHFGSK